MIWLTVLMRIWRSIETVPALAVDNYVIFNALP
jgi:hypothetical protein